MPNIMILSCFTLMQVAFIFSTIQYSSMCVHMCVFTSVLLLTDTDNDFFFFFAVTKLTAMNTVNTSPWAHGQELF